MTENEGVLIGEIFLMFLFIRILLSGKRKLRLTPLFIVFQLFLSYTILISSLLNGILYVIFPWNAILYFLRVLLYTSLYFYFQNSAAAECKVVLKYFTWPFIIGSFFSLSIMVVRYLVNPPSPTEVLWGYSLGARNIPIFALALSKDSFLFLRPIGGGAGNLLSTWSLINVIIFENYYSQFKEKKKLERYRTIVWFLVTTNILTSFSRGGILTLFLLWFYLSLKKILISRKLRIKSLALILLLIVIPFFLVEILVPVTVFDRLKMLFDFNDGLEPSSYGRVVNYDFLFSNLTMYTWIFGGGFDESTSLKNFKIKFAESFYLDIIRSGGAISMLIFNIFLFLIFITKSQSIFARSLKEFIAIESVVMWSVTGGDFYSAPVLYFICVALGMLTREAKNGRTRTIEPRK
ncbi:MAG: hypothetical protein ACPLVG_08245 [Pseudothermotoga sp.]